jgi:hypothetical protein
VQDDDDDDDDDDDGDGDELNKRHERDKRPTKDEVKR